MTVEGVDFSWARPGGAALVAAGKRFVIRYVPYRLADGRWTGKGLTRAEVKDYRAHGLDIALVFESTAGRAKDGQAAGVNDAKVSQAAIASFADLGMPQDLPVYFAVDFDTTSAHWPAIDAYMDGAASVLGRARVGVYGEKSLIDHLRGNGKAAWYWQTYAWSGGLTATGIHVKQYLNGQTINGGAVDLCRAYQADFGQWPAAQEEDMTAIATPLLGHSADLGNDARIRTAPSTATGSILRTVDNEQWPAVIGWVKGENTSGSDQWLMRWSGSRYEYTHKVNVDRTWDPTPFSEAQVEAAQDAAVESATAPLEATIAQQAGQIASQAGTISTLQADLTAANQRAANATAAEKERLAVAHGAKHADEIRAL